MKISFTKSSAKEHHLHILRQDGSEDHKICETRSFLIHDLTHLAFELESKINIGFWGSIASGQSFSDLSKSIEVAKLDSTTEIFQIEKAVAIFQSLAGKNSAEDIVETFKQQKSNFAWARPEWFELAFVSRVNQRLQSLLGHWKATRFGDSMVVLWEELD